MIIRIQSLRKPLENKFLLSSEVIGTVEVFHPASSVGEGLIENNNEPQGTMLLPHNMNIYHANCVPSTETSQKIVCSLLNHGNNVLSHNKFMDFASNLINACIRNKNIGMSGSAFILQMLKILEGNNPVCINDDLASNL